MRERDQLRDSGVDGSIILEVWNEERCVQAFGRET
jgi:hypothetical protein